MVARYLPTPDVDRVLSNAQNLYDYLIGRGIADLRRMPSEVIRDHPQCTVRRYEPTAPAQPGELPVLLVPPMAATAVCFDLRRGCSLAEYLLDQGRRVYLVDYGDLSSQRDQDLGLEHWIDGVLPGAIKSVVRDSGSEPVQLIGWCLGGILAMFTEAAHPELPIASVATVASPFDFSQVRAIEPVRLMEKVTDGLITTSLVRVLGGIPGKFNTLFFKWVDPRKQLKKPLVVFRNRANREVLAQISAVDALVDTMEAYPGRSIAQIYHTFIRTNHLAQGHMTLRGGRVIELADVQVPVMNIAGEADLFFAPPASVYRVADLLPNAPSVRLETAPGGHLGVLSGRAARNTTWRYLTEFLDEVDRRHLGDRPSRRPATARRSRTTSRTGAVAKRAARTPATGTPATPRPRAGSSSPAPARSQKRTPARRPADTARAAASRAEREATGTGTGPGRAAPAAADRSAGKPR